MVSDYEMRQSILREAMDNWERQDELWTPSHKAKSPVEDIFSPQNFNEYIGQGDAKALAQIMIEAARKDDRPLPNILITGEYGLGKTALARLIMQAYGVHARLVAGSAVNAELPTGHVIIDEIHNLNPETADTLNILLDQGKVHIVGCTTDSGILSAAFRSRFRMLTLETYTVQDLTSILHLVAKKKNIVTTREILKEVAVRSRFNARVAISNLALIFDILTIRNQSSITKPVIREAFTKIGIDERGFLKRDYKFMNALPDNRAVGLQYLTAVTGIDPKTIEEEVEPYLLRMGLLDRTPRGRLKLKDI